MTDEIYNLPKEEFSDKMTEAEIEILSAIMDKTVEDYNKNPKARWAKKVAKKIDEYFNQAKTYSLKSQDHLETARRARDFLVNNWGLTDYQRYAFASRCGSWGV